MDATYKQQYCNVSNAFYHHVKISLIVIHVILLRIINKVILYFYTITLRC